MAFLRKEKKASGTYLRIVESYRDPKGQCRHRTLYKLGKAEDYSQTTLKKIGTIFMELAGEPIAQKAGFKELARYNYGFVRICDKLLKTYGLDVLIHRIAKKKNLSYNLYKHLLLMLAERLNDPASKRSNYRHRQEYLGLEEMQLHNLYRSLDCLAENQQEIQELIYSQGRHLFNQKLDVVFYDVTTFYFESEQEDGFRMKGFSKDGKIGKTVIVFGLLIDKDKNPVGYKIYKGGFYEGHSFVDALRKLKEQYQIEKVIMVADRGMMSRANISQVEDEAGYEYIIGERLRSLPAIVIEKILDRSKYSSLEVTEESTGEPIRIEYMTTEHEGRRIIATYSPKRAAKDRRERDKRIEKGLEMLGKPWQAEKKPRRNYLKKQGGGRYVLDEEKIEEDSRYDGIVCIATNNKELSTQRVLSEYKQLYKIEHSFRTFKSYLETRPMYHWTQPRIEGHLCLCYIAFTLLNYLRRAMERSGTKCSERDLREAMDKMQLSLVEQGNQEYYMRSKHKQLSERILKVLKQRKIPDFMPKKAITDYISID